MPSNDDHIPAEQADEALEQRFAELVRRYLHGVPPFGVTEQDGPDRR